MILSLVGRDALVAFRRCDDDIAETLFDVGRLLLARLCVVL
jgi:hypothetical protein